MTPILIEGLALFAARRINFEQILRTRGLHAKRTCLYRSPQDQAKLYLSGRTTPGPIRTWARAGKSPHNFGHDASDRRPPASLAADYAPLIDGRINWEPADSWWAAFGHAARQAHLDWGGRWKSRTDRPHVQLPNWRSYTLGTV